MAARPTHSRVAFNRPRRRIIEYPTETRHGLSGRAWSPARTYVKPDTRYHGVRQYRTVPVADCPPRRRCLSSEALMDRDGAPRMSPDRERALVARAREDWAAFGELYDSSLPRIHAFIYRRVRERSVAEDLTSMTFQRKGPRTDRLSRATSRRKRSRWPGSSTTRIWTRSWGWRWGCFLPRHLRPRRSLRRRC